MHNFITFSSQGSSCPSPTHLCFFSGKIPSNVAARLTRKYWVPNFRHFVTIPPPPPLFTTICYYWSLFVTIRHYSRLFATIRDYSHYSSLFAVRYSRLFAIRYSGFPDTPQIFCEVLWMEDFSRRPVQQFFQAQKVLTLEFFIYKIPNRFSDSSRKQ